MTTKKVACIILAAGESKRLGQAKQLVQWNGDYLINHALCKAKHSNMATTLVVVGAAIENLCEIMHPKPEHIVLNPAWKNGIGTSIAAGVDYIKKRSENYDGVCIAMVDDPLLPLEHYSKMLKTFDTSNAEIVASKYTDTWGVPAIFSQAFFHSLSALNANKGAKKIIQANLSAVEFVPTNTKFQDVDTPADLNHLLQKNNATQ